MKQPKVVITFSFMIYRKGVFLVLDLYWNVFRQTGNIETYLLMKELEADNKKGIEDASSAMEQEDPIG